MGGRFVRLCTDPQVWEHIGHWISGIHAEPSVSNHIEGHSVIPGCVGEQSVSQGVPVTPSLVPDFLGDSRRLWTFGSFGGFDFVQGRGIIEDFSLQWE